MSFNGDEDITLTIFLVIGFPFYIERCNCFFFLNFFFCLFTICTKNKIYICHIWLLSMYFFMFIITMCVFLFVYLTLLLLFFCVNLVILYITELSGFFFCHIISIFCCRLLQIPIFFLTLWKWEMNEMKNILNVWSYLIWYIVFLLTKKKNEILCKNIQSTMVSN